MNVKIELIDPRFCDGCPLLDYHDGRGFYCSYFRWRQYNDKQAERFIRPQECVDKNGE